MHLIENTSFLYFKVQIARECSAAFIDWQTDLHAAVASADGFLSLEFLAAPPAEKLEWQFTLRFCNAITCLQWQESETFATLLKKVKLLLAPGTEVEMENSASKMGALFNTRVTELFVTELHPNQEKAFRTWVAKMHQAEAKFPGFCGVYVQAPSPYQAQAKHWITFLQFDSQEHLDHWLNSPERCALLRQSESLVAALEDHRVISAYPGWFHAFTNFSQEVPPLWKQGMLVLLVLFPVVMLEMKHLSPLTAGFNPSMAMFIGNVISVALVTWPLMPLVIKLMHWWLMPAKSKYAFWISGLGTALLFVIYWIEIQLFV